MCSDLRRLKFGIGILTTLALIQHIFMVQDTAPWFLSSIRVGFVYFVSKFQRKWSNIPFGSQTLDPGYRNIVGDFGDAPVLRQEKKKNLHMYEAREKLIYRFQCV